jgi:hypothetical protein
MEEWKREILYEERKSNTSEFVKVVGLDAFYYLLFNFFFVFLSF